MITVNDIQTYESRMKYIKEVTDCAASAEKYCNFSSWLETMCEAWEAFEAHKISDMDLFYVAIEVEGDMNDAEARWECHQDDS